VSNLVGRVHFTSSIDGKNMPRDAERVGERAGKAAGLGYDKEWNKSFRDTLTKAGQRSYDAWKKNGERDGGIYADAVDKRLTAFLAKAKKNFESLRLEPGFLDDFAKGFDDAGLAAGELQRQLQTLRDKQMVNASAFEAAKRQVSEWAEAQRDASEAAARAERQAEQEREARERLTAAMAEQERRSRQIAEWQQQNARATENYNRVLREHELTIYRANRQYQSMDSVFDGFTRRVERATHGTREFNLQWRELPHNFRQWSLIIGAVLAGMEDLAVLGSAAGAGLIAVGGAATSAVIGLGGLVVIIATLGRDLDEVPRDLRSLAAEMQGFGKVFRELGETITRGAALQLSGVFDRLGGDLRALSPELTRLGRTIGTLFRDLEANIRPGTEGFEELREAVDLASDNFDSLARSAGTFGLAFLHAFNRAQPLVEDLTGWVGRLARQFNDFTRSSGFDEWMRNAEVTFSHFGELLDAVGRTLNNLVTPDSVQRTAQFLENLTEFMPALEGFLDLLGRLDIFGLIAQGLNDLGQGMEPLGPALADLADALNRIISIGLDEFSDVLRGVAQALAPVAQGFADMLNAIPEDVLRGVANGLAALAGAFVAFKTGSAIYAAMGAVNKFNGSLNKLATEGGKAGRALRVLGRAGLWGAVAVGGVAAANAVEELFNNLFEYEDAARRAATSTTTLDAAVRQTIAGNEAQSRHLGDVRTALEQLMAVQEKGPFQRWIGDLILVDRESAALALGLNNLAAQLGKMAATSITQAAETFNQWAGSINASDEEILAMLKEMPEFTAALDHAAGGVDGIATDQERLNYLLDLGVTAAQNNGTAIEDMAAKAEQAQQDIEDLADKIRNFGDTQISTLEATAAFEQAVDDLTESIKENGGTLDLNTQKGRDNQAALLDAIEAAKEHAAAVLEETGSLTDANVVLNDHKARLEETLRQLGLNEDEIAQYTAQLELIPTNVFTYVDLDSAEALRQAELLRRAILNIPQNRTVTVSVAGGWNPTVGQRPMAEGGVLDRPTHVLAGEAGREAFVPLDRPLSQVDPSVRWLAAIAQGKSPIPHMANGGIAGPSGPQIVVSEGAIVVNESGDPRRSANEVLTRLVEDVVG